jgi:D-alanine-D-alanine ligase
MKLALIFGGRSSEHEVSVVSAEHVIAAAPPGVEIVPIGVTKNGVWLTTEETRASLSRAQVAFSKEMQGRDRSRCQGLAESLRALEGVDAVFPLIHGTHGEDGTLQGMLDLAGIPYVGCGVAASALGMDKALMKTTFRGAGLAVAEHVVIEAPEWTFDGSGRAREAEERIGYPAFVKPANGGSSLGVSKVGGREELVAAVAEAGRYDHKVLIEKAIEGREVECGVLGNRDATASPIGEVKHTREFYDYRAKYLDASTQILAPADLPAETAARIQKMALAAFHSLDCSGLARVDFFLQDDGSLIIDEINTLPGFTPASMYPRLWQEAGVSYSSLVERLIDFALARHRERPIA